MKPQILPVLQGNFYFLRFCQLLEDRKYFTSIYASCNITVSRCSKSMPYIIKLKFSDSPLIILSKLVPNSAHSQNPPWTSSSTILQDCFRQFFFPSQFSLLFSPLLEVLFSSLYLILTYFFTFNAVFMSYFCHRIFPYYPTDMHFSFIHLLIFHLALSSFSLDYILFYIVVQLLHAFVIW